MTPIDIFARYAPRNLEVSNIFRNFAQNTEINYEFMETKKHLITMILALMAMCMGTQVMAQTPMLVSEID